MVQTEIINELLNKINELIVKNQNEIENNSNLIATSNTSIDDKKVINELLENIDINALEEKLDTLKKYTTDDEIRNINSYIATYKLFAPIMREKFFNSNKGIIESILRKVDSSITIVDVDKLRSNNDRMNNHIEKMKELREKINSNNIARDDFSYIYNFCKVLGIDVVDFMQEYTISSLSPLYDQVGTIEIEPVAEVLEENDAELSSDDLINLFARYNCDFNALKEKKQKELLKYASLDNIEGILETFKNYNINLGEEYNNGTIFTEIPSLIDLFIYTKAADVRKTLENLENFNLLSSMTSLVESLKTIDKFIPRKKKYKKKKKTCEGGNGGNSISGKLEDFKNNLVYFYTEFKGSILKINPSMAEDEIKKLFAITVYNKCAYIFSESYEANLNRIEILKRYNIGKNTYLSSLSSLQGAKITSSFDQLIEVDCYNYLCDNISIVKFDNVKRLLINAKQILNIDNEFLFSEKKNHHILRIRDKKLVCNRSDIVRAFENASVSPTIKTSASYIKEENKELFKQLDEVVKDEFNDTEEDFFKNFDYNKNVVESKGFEYFDKLSDFIDSNNPLIIRIDGIPVSRIKLLRVYNIFNNHSMPDSLDKLMYAITFNSHYTKEQVEIIGKKIYSFAPVGKEKIKWQIF